MAKITVTAGPGRTVPMHHTIATGPGGRHLLITPGDELEVDDAITDVQRRLRAGDLVRVEKPRPRAPGERFSAATVELTGSGPPAVFGDLPLVDPAHPGPHTEAPQKVS